jgi:hypothetical protein
MQTPELDTGVECSEPQVVALVGDFEIFQSIILLPQVGVSTGQFKGRPAAVLEGFSGCRQSLLK